MSNTTRDVVAANTLAADAFLTLSKVNLASIERLSALNLNTLREAIEDCTAATKTLSEKTLSEARGGDVFQNLLSVFGPTMWEKALTHSRNTYEIIAKTHEEISKVIVAQLSQPYMTSVGPVGMNAMFDLFAKGSQQVTASVNENVAIADEAGSKAVAATTAYTKKAA